MRPGDMVRLGLNVTALNPATGVYDSTVQFCPQVIDGAGGFAPWTITAMFGVIISERIISNNEVCRAVFTNVGHVAIVPEKMMRSI